MVPLVSGGAVFEGNRSRYLIEVEYA